MIDRSWVDWHGYECPIDEEILLDIRFDSWKVLENLYPWDFKWTGNNHGFGHVIAYRKSAANRDAS